MWCLFVLPAQNGVNLTIVWYKNKKTDHCTTGWSIIKNIVDFVVHFIFEIGGKNKQQKQIEKDGKSFVVKDDIEFGYLNVIPLWAFGLNY